MKKVIFTLILGLTISLSSIAQINKHNIGVFMGGGISSTSQLLSNSMGYNIGLSYTYKINKRFAIITGLDYDRRGSYLNSDVQNISGNIQSYDFNNNFDFISAPLLLNINIGNKVKYFVNTGVSLAYLISQKQTTSIGGKTHVYYGKENFNKFEIDLNIGIGVLFPLSEKIDLSVEVKYKKGLTDIIKEHPFGGDKQTTSNALLLLGLNYRL